MNITGIIKGATLLCSKHKSAILSGLGIVSGAATAVLCIRQTIKAKDVIEQLEEERRAIAAESTHELVVVKEADVKLSKKEVVKATWKLYILPTATMALSITSIVFAHRMDAKRIAAATAALALSEKAYKELEDKTLAEVGQKQFAEIKKKIAKDHADTDPRTVGEAKQLSVCDEQLRFRENITNAEFYSNWRYVEHAINELNKDALEGCGMVTINDMLYKFGCDPIDIGDSLGWDVTRNLITYTYDAVVTKDQHSCIVLEFSKPHLI